ncbi:MAG: gliding motility-associated C-terminal domain-containing protein [Flavobacteriia bacterium]|nr:gliding motility-associated C-terminal domain-containing protein [Flavobacteriia bacterium]
MNYFKSYFLFFLFFKITLIINSQCNLPPINLGNDTTLCQGDSLILTIDNQYQNIYWFNGNTSSTYTVKQEGTFSVNSIVPGINAIFNGDFEQGNTGFTTSYVLGSVDGGGAFGLLTNVQTYEITTSPSLVHNNFPFCSYQNNMMVVNGATTPGQLLWCQTANVLPNTNYILSTDVSNVISVAIVPTLIFSVENQQISNPYSSSDVACDWGTFSGSWYSDTNTVATVCIVNVNIEGPGNDFAIDNIQLIPQCVYSDEINVQYDSISYYLRDSVEFCNDLSEWITVDSLYSSCQYIWNTGETNDSIVPKINGYHYLEIISPNQCSYFDSVFVAIIQTPIADFSYTILNDNAPFHVQIDNLSSTAESYNWNVSGQSQFTDTTLTSHTFEYIYMGDFSISLIANNKYCDDTINKHFSLSQNIQFPNFFSPNNDGVNDFFSIDNINPDSFKIEIRNRWGNVVFTANDPYFKWDGEDETGKKCGEGTYFYFLSFYNHLGELITHHDFVQLIE